MMGAELCMSYSAPKELLEVKQSILIPSFTTLITSINFYYLSIFLRSAKVLKVLVKRIERVDIRDWGGDSKSRTTQ